MIRRTIVHRRNRRQVSIADRGQSYNAVPVASDPSSSSATLTFAVPMTLGPIPAPGSPLAITCGAQTLLSVVQTSPLVWVLTFSGAVSSNDVVIPQLCPTFRTYQRLRCCGCLPYHVSSTLLVGLISWWRLHDSLDDNVGPNSLTPSGSPVYGSGLLGDALRRNGGNKSPLTGIDLISPVPFSFAAWIFGAVPDEEETSAIFRVASNCYLLFFAEADADGHIDIRIKGLNFGLPDAGYGWHHYAGVTDGTDYSLWIDGVSVATGSSPVAPDVQNVNISAGTQEPDCGIQLCGLWDRALTPTEISELYNGGAGFDPTA